MNGSLTYLLIALISYALGNINPAIIIGRLHGIDIRKEGSGNAGMTNTIRVIGLWAGILVFLVDVLKAFFAVKIGIFLDGEYTGGLVAFAFVVLGHCYPALYKFKGGKGVAASLGAALALNWQSALAAALIAGVLFLVSGKKMSVGSLGAALSYPFLLWHFMPDRYCVIFAVFMVSFLMVQHIANIRRLARGEEKSLTIGHAEHEQSDVKDSDTVIENTEGKEEV